MDSPGCGERTERTWTSSALTAVVVACTTSPCATYRTGMTNWTGFAVGVKVSSDRAVFIEPTSVSYGLRAQLQDSKQEATSLGGDSGAPSEREAGAMRSGERRRDAYNGPVLEAGPRPEVEPRRRGDPAF